MIDLTEFESRAVPLRALGVVVSQNGTQLARKLWDDACRRNVYSASKSFTSMAVGIAQKEGLLSIDEKLTDAFKDDLPEIVSDNLKAATVRDLLTMSCGHETEINTFDVNEPDWIKNFLSHEFKYKPGTCFMYNTAGTNMLCAALKRRTGENLFEYLTPRLFEPLGIENIECFCLPDGIEMGGAGSRLKTEDMARFILDVRAEWGVTVLMVEHDMGMVMDLSDHVVVLNFGQVISQGVPAVVQADPEVNRAYLGSGNVDELRAKLRAAARIPTSAGAAA